MTQENNASTSSPLITTLKGWLFPLGVACLYGIGLVFASESTERALHISVSMFRQLILPICLAFIMMVFFNRFLSPVTVMKFLGHRAGFKGILFSSMAGVLSMGPVYAWYPVLKSLGEKGAADFHIANFMGSRSVKPVLLPILVTYWGWKFSMLFVMLSMTGALIVACIVSVLCSRSNTWNGQSRP